MDGRIKLCNFHDKKISDLQRRLDIQYDKIDEVEEAIADLKSRVYELKKIRLIRKREFN